jgi:prevent-host-death family protein
MQTIGIRELKAHLSEVLREVEENGKIIDVTNRGEVVVRLVPMRRRRPNEQQVNAIISDLDTMANELAAYWPEGMSVEDAIDDVRR